MFLLAALVGEEAPVDRAQCAILSRKVWRGKLLERLCCRGRIYLAQNQGITAQAGECRRKAKDEMNANWMTIASVVCLRWWM